MEVTASEMQTRVTFALDEVHAAPQGVAVGAVDVVQGRATGYGL